MNEFYRKKKINKKKVLGNVLAELDSLSELLKICKKQKVKKFIFISSASVYPKNKTNKSFKTTDKIKPTDLYGSTKYAMEILGKKMFKNFISLRLFQVYGLNDKKFRLVPTVINNKKIFLSDCMQVTDMIYYKDLNFLIEKIINSKKIFKGTFNAGSGRPIILKNVVKKIIKIKKNKTIVKYKKGLNKISNYSYAGEQELRTKLKWKPKYDLEMGLSELINEKHRYN